MGDKRLTGCRGTPWFADNAALVTVVKAAYRLFDNEKVSPEKILAPHFERLNGCMNIVVFLRYKIRLILITLIIHQQKVNRHVKRLQGIVRLLLSMDRVFRY